jgi:hypothetical protein
MTGFGFRGVFSTFGTAFVRKFSGMVKFTPQYTQAMRMAPASGSLGAPHAEQLNCVIEFVLQCGDYKWTRHIKPP